MVNKTVWYQGDLNLREVYNNGFVFEDNASDHPLAIPWLMVFFRQNRKTG